MRPDIMLIALAAALAGFAAGPARTADRPAVETAYAAKILTPAQAVADVALMRRALETVHPGLYRYRTRVEIDAAFARLEAVTRRPLSDLALWRAIALMLAEIHCDHTKPEMSEAIERYRTSHPTHLPVRFDMIEGRMIVVSSDSQPGAPPRGAEITAINGRSVPEIVQTLGRAAAYDGDTDEAIVAKLSADGDLMGDDLNEYWPAFYGFPQRWDLTFKGPNAVEQSKVSLAPISFKAWTRLAWPGQGYRDEFYKAITWKVAGKTAYLRIDTFVNYRNPVDATAFLGGFLKTLPDQEEVDHLILDLRDNGGGSEDVSVALGRNLLPTTFTWSKPLLLKAIRYGDLPDHIESWGDRKALFSPPEEGFRRTADGWWEQIPREGDDESTRPQAVLPERFSGKLTILTGPRNGSGATRTIAQFKDKLGARLVGEDAAGSAEGPTAGHIFLLTLPNSGLKVRVPNAWNRSDIRSFTPRRGVAADEIVIPTLLDFEAGRDQTLDVAKGAQVLPPPPLSEVLGGSWRGALDYRDYRTDQRVTLPTELAAATGADGLSLAFTYDDGPGKIVHATEVWRLSDRKDALRIDGDVFRVVELRGGALSGDVTLVADGAGLENEQPVDVRIVLTRRGSDLSAARLTRHRGEAFLLRHAYRLQRAPAP